MCSICILSLHLHSFPPVPPYSFPQSNSMHIRLFIYAKNIELKLNNMYYINEFTCVVQTAHRPDHLKVSISFKADTLAKLQKTRCESL